MRVSGGGSSRVRGGHSRRGPIALKSGNQKIGGRSSLTSVRLLFSFIIVIIKTLVPLENQRTCIKDEIINFNFLMGCGTYF